MIKKINILLVLILIVKISLAQVFFVQNSAQFNIEAGAFLVVEGDVINNNGGNSVNNGEIKLLGDWYNNSTGTFFSNTDNGHVFFYGGNQSINGNTSYFNSVTLGGGEVVKTLNTNAHTYGVLKLQDAMLETNNYIHYHKNPTINSVKWNKGFVSSQTLGGYFARATNTSNEYYFPVGSTNLDFTYRPVAIKPNTSALALGEFAVRCAGINPDFDIGLSLSNATGPFPRNQNEENIEAANGKFYHNIFQLSGNDNFEVEIAYFNADGNFSSVAQWTNNLKWSNLKTPTQTGSFSTFYNQPDHFVSFFIENPNHDEFVLIQPNEIFNVFVPNAFTPDGDGLNDLFIPILFGYEEFKNYEFLIYNRWGEIIFETHQPSFGWSGTFKNEKVQLGIYTWQLNFSAIANNNLINHKKIGHVMLVQ